MGISPIFSFIGIRDLIQNTLKKYVNEGVDWL